MPVAAPRGVTPDSLSGLLPVPMGILEGPEGEGLLQLIKKLSSPRELSEKGVTVKAGRMDEWGKTFLSDLATKYKGMLEPGINSFPLNFSKYPAYDLLYASESGEPLAAAAISRDPTGKWVTSGFASDKSKGVAAARAVLSLGKHLLEKGAAEPVSGHVISPDTAKLLQHLNKLAGKTDVEEPIMDFISKMIGKRAK